MQHQHHQGDHHRINDSFYCRRANKPDGLILVHNLNHYIMAEYSEFSGEAKWQRVVLATQRDAVERWLLKNFPLRTQQVTAVVAPRKATSAKAAAGKG